MRFFLDENFPKSAVSMLTALGHEVFDVRGTGCEGMADAEIFLQAISNSAVFLTTDRDFFHTVPHLHEHHSGVVVIALRQPNRARILEKLDWILKRLNPVDFTDRVIQLRDRTWIVFPPMRND